MSEIEIMSEKPAKRVSGETRLSLLEKFLIVSELEGPNPRTKAAIAREKGVKPPAINYIWSQRDSIKENYNFNPSNAKELKSSKGPEKFKDIDEPLLTWFQNNRVANKIVDGNMLLTQARKAAVRLGINSEDITESWVQRWRARHGIKSLVLHGEAADCPDYADWLEAHKCIFEKYPVGNILNFDETALFWRVQNKRTFVLAAENSSQIRGRKANKSRVTLLVGCAADGKKEALIVVGTAANPRWPLLLGQRTRTKAPLTYYSSKKGWMNQHIFGQILADLEMRFKKQKRNCLVLLDNCSSHKGFCDMYDGTKTNMRIIMLPKNTTSKLQPCDQGVIRSLKAKYRGRLGKLSLAKDSDKISLYEGLMIIRASWNIDVHESVILNAWKKSGLFGDPDTGNGTPDFDGLEDTDDTDIHEMAKIEDDINVDEEPEQDIMVIMNDYLGIEESAENVKEEQSDNDSVCMEQNLPPTTEECLQFLFLIESRFLTATGDIPDALIDLKTQLAQLPKKQSSITDFFTRSD